MKEFFKELFEYGNHFNQKLATIFLEKPEKISEKSIQLFSHILNAHQIWNNRILPEQPVFGVWQIHSIDQFRIIDETNFQHSLRILDKFDLKAPINYANSRGDAFNNTVRDMLFHAINHSTYHRAQIATEFRQSGITPLATDYIFYKR